MLGNHERPRYPRVQPGASCTRVLLGNCGVRLIPDVQGTKALRRRGRSPSLHRLSCLCSLGTQHISAFRGQRVLHSWTHLLVPQEASPTALLATTFARPEVLFFPRFPANIAGFLGDFALFAHSDCLSFPPPCSPCHTPGQLVRCTAGK